MIDDLVERLEEMNDWLDTVSDPRDARIEALTAEIERLRGRIETAIDGFERITQHKLGTPGLRYESLERLIESAAGTAELYRAALAQETPEHG